MKDLKKGADLEGMKRIYNWYKDYMSKPESEREPVRQSLNESTLRLVFAGTFDVKFPDNDINHIIKYLETNLK